MVFMWRNEDGSLTKPPAGWRHSDPPPVDADGNPWTRRRETYQRKRPLPKDRIPWEPTAVCPLIQMQPGDSRFEELIRGELKIEDARTDYEIRCINEENLSSLEIWPPETLVKDAEDFPIPERNHEWKSDRYWKAECEDFILDESMPDIQRVDCLVERLRDCNHVYSKFDLVEKGLAMLHDLKMHIQGDNDWRKVYRLEYQLKARLVPGEDKDTLDPRSWKTQCEMVKAGFIRQQWIDMMREEGYDMDFEFSRVFGLESSPRVKRGESPVQWEGWNPDGPIDWGQYRPLKPMTNGTMINGYYHHSTRQVSEQEEDSEEGEDDATGSDTKEVASEEMYDGEEAALFDDEEASYEDEDDLADEEVEVYDESGDGYEEQEAQADLVDDDDSDQEEITSEMFNQAASARKSSARSPEPQSNADSVGLDKLRALIQASHGEGYDEEEESSQMSANDLYEDDEAGMDYDEEDFFNEDAMHGSRQVSQDRFKQNFRDMNEGVGSSGQEGNDEGEDDPDEGLENEGSQQRSSVADSDELEILGERYTGDPASEEDADQGPTEYQMLAATATGVSEERAEDVFDEQGQAFGVNFAVEHNYPNEGRPEDSSLPEDEMLLDQPLIDETQETDDASTLYQSFPPDMRQVLAVGSESPMQQYLNQETAELELSPTGDGFLDIAKRAIQRTSADQSNKTTENSGLSSPPSSQQTDDELVEDAQEPTEQRRPASPQVLIKSDDIDPELTTLPKVGHNRKRSSMQAHSTTHTPQASFSGSVQYSPPRPHDITPFRVEHPRTATGVIVIPDPTPARDGTEEGQNPET